MKQLTLYTLIIACLTFAAPTSAQHKKYKGEMIVTPLQLEQIGDSLHVSIDFDFRGMSVNSRRSISLIPILAAPGMERDLPEVVVKGRADYLCYKRHVALMSKAQRQLHDQKLPYAIIKGYKKNETKQVRYNKVLAFEPWMKDARLNMRKDLCGCGNPPRPLMVAQLGKTVQLEQIVEPYVITPYLTYVQPEVEAVKKREMVGEAFLDFAVAKTDIRPDYMNNPRELKKITDMMEEVRNDPSVLVRGISVVGYASPEGTLKFNRYLSENRATALVGYLAPRFNFPRSMYHVEFGGENWNELLEAVNNSQIRYKEQVLAILTNMNISDDTRKTMLKRLASGEPYRQMLNDYYPALRKAVCKIDYEVKGFDVVEAAEVFKTRPQNLSLNEMFLVAKTYEAGSQEFIDVFETAVRMFPQDETANLNAAMAALSREDTVSAERYLGKIRSRVRVPEYDNATGVLMILRGEYDKAEVFLKAAAEAGLTSAKSNLDELQKKRENIELINNKKR